MLIYDELPLNNFLIVGSRALGIREADDIDVICYSKDILPTVDGQYSKNNKIFSFYHKGIRVECLLADDDESLQFIMELEKDNWRSFASIETLYVLKQGHISVPSPKWELHMQDFQYLLNLLRAGLRSWSEDSFNKACLLHTKTTKERLKRDTPKLKGMSKSKFFDDAVVKYVDHDRIHEWMAIEEEPAYKLMQLPGNDIQCEHDLFYNKMTHSQRMYAVMEEARVITCERGLIPKIIKFGSDTIHRDDVLSTYKWALMRICTTLTSGWFREFAQINYMEILNYSTFDFPSKIRVEELDREYMYKQKINEENSTSGK